MLEQLYLLIFKPFFPKGTKNIGLRSRGQLDTRGVDGRHDTHSQFIHRDLSAAIIQYHQKRREFIVDDIYILTVQKIFMKIHPFIDNNFAFISLLTDILLLHNKILPISLKNTVRDSNYEFYGY